MPTSRALFLSREATSVAAVDAIQKAGSKVVWFYNSDNAVINPGDVVTYDYAALDILIDDGPVTGSGVDQAVLGITKVKRTAATSTGVPAAGVAFMSGALSGTFPAIVAGFCPHVKTDAAVAAGELIVADNAGVGTCDTYAGATHTTAPPLGMAMNADSALGCSAMIFPTPSA